MRRHAGNRVCRVSSGAEWIVRGERQMLPSPFSLVGIVNITPDSFSDGGRFVEPGKAVAHGLRLLEDGAAMLDLGAESTRPFATPVSGEDEQARLMPVLEALRRQRPEAVLSVDTFKAETARRALEAGADVINDISACLFDPPLLEVVARYKPGYVLMHSQGRPADMQIAPRYDDVVETVLAFFERRMDVLVRAGLPEDRIVLDPGIGFGKNREHTMALLRGMERFQRLGRPLYVGLSRKSLFGDLLGLAPGEREEATRLAVALLAVRGVAWHRVHDVAGCARALRLAEAMTPPSAYRAEENPAGYRQ